MNLTKIFEIFEKPCISHKYFRFLSIFLRPQFLVRLIYVWLHEVFFLIIVSLYFQDEKRILLLKTAFLNLVSKVSAFFKYSCYGFIILSPNTNCKFDIYKKNEF